MDLLIYQNLVQDILKYSECCAAVYFLLRSSSPSAEEDAAAKKVQISLRGVSEYHSILLT